MSLNLKSESPYIQEIANRAGENGFACVRFVPSQIDPTTHEITGESFDSISNQWIPSKFPLPDIIYDRCFYGDDYHSKRCMAITHWLKKREDITFLGYGLPNKLELFEALINTELAPYLPKTYLARSTDQVLSFLDSEKRIILKPITGSQGNGIYFLAKDGSNVIVKTEKQRRLIEKMLPLDQKLSQWIEQLIHKKAYLVQPYLPLHDRNGCPFDIRVLIQKDESGSWVVRGKGIRKGQKNGVLSNLSAGSEVQTFDEWIKTIPASLRGHVKQELQEILMNIPQLLEKTFLPLFELGVDIGFAKDGSLWILDINSKPGRKVIFATDPDMKEILYSAPLKFGKLVLESDRKAVKTNHENSLSY